MKIVESIVDGELVNRLKKGNNDAFAELYYRYARKIYNIARKMGLTHEDAEGVVQDVFIKIWRNRSSLDCTLSFNAYLITIARSVVIKYFKQAARKAAYEQYAISSFTQSVNDTENYVIFSELDERYSQVIEQMPVRQKQIFMMKNFQHLSIAEIALQLNVSSRTVENQIYRATKLMREKLID